MKKTFHEKVGSNEIETHFQEKFKECLNQLRNGFNDLRKRRKEYKTAKLSKKSETKNNWKAIKQGHKIRIKQCKKRISKARMEFKLLVESMRLNIDKMPVPA